MTEYGNSEQERQQRDSETVVEAVLRDAVELFESQKHTNLTTLHRAKDKFVTYAIDMYAVQSVSCEIVDKPANPRLIIEKRAVNMFKQRYNNHNNNGTDIPLS
ncbi:hypothetical protein [Halobellus sp. GM3]|uniref:hypothetical protein n=1 Tax=Halobellus sp. GM3 TaxID=3458410 RepID=UPI00403DAEB5